MGKLMEVVELVRNRLNGRLEVKGIVVCMFRAQTNLAREVLSEVRSFFGDVVFETRIRQNINLAEAPSHGKSIFDYAIHSNGAQDYLALTDEILAQESGSRRSDLTEAEPEQGDGIVPAQDTSLPEEARIAGDSGAFDGAGAVETVDTASESETVVDVDVDEDAELVDATGPVETADGADQCGAGGIEDRIGDAGARLNPVESEEKERALEDGA